MLDQAPPEIWIGLPARTWRPVVRDLPLKFVQISGPAHEAGVEVRVIEGVEVKVLSPAATIVHLLKIRRLVGEEVAAAAVKTFMREHPGEADDLIRVAGVCRAARALRRMMAPAV